MYVPLNTPLGIVSKIKRSKSSQNGKFHVFKQKQGEIFKNTDISKTFSLFFFWGGGEGGADLNFCENNIGFYTGTLKICKKRCGRDIVHIDAIDPNIGSPDGDPIISKY